MPTRSSENIPPMSGNKEYRRSSFPGFEKLEDWKRNPANKVAKAHRESLSDQTIGKPTFLGRMWNRVMRGPEAENAMDKSL